MEHGTSFKWTYRWMYAHGWFCTVSAQKLSKTVVVSAKSSSGALELSCACRVRVYAVQNWLCRLAPSLLKMLWDNIQQLQVQKLAPIGFQIFVTEWMWNIRVGILSMHVWFKNCIRGIPTKFISLYLMHIHIYTHRYMYICIYYW